MTASVGMYMPQGISNCPRGLEYLTMVDQLLIHQHVELVEAVTGFETKNKYSIKNSLDQEVYFAMEKSHWLTRNCCAYLRPIDMIILDNYENEVIRMYRPLKCAFCCFPCCLQRMEVSSPSGAILGTVEQKWSIIHPLFVVKNAIGDIVFKIKGPFCTWGICKDVDFKITSFDSGVQVGKISKQWSGLAREALTDADYFSITFPMNLDVRMKAVMLGACLLIDLVFYES